MPLRVPRRGRGCTPRQNSVVAELAPQHVQDEAALFVEVAVEEIDRRLVVPADDGPLVAAVRLAEVRVDVAGDAVLVLVAAEAVLALDVLEVRREALVEPARATSRGT